MNSEVSKVLGRDGFRLECSPYASEQLKSLRSEVDRLQARESQPKAGIRDALEVSPRIREAVTEAFGLASRLDWGSPEVLRCLLFDKRPGSNWRVGWHQDLNIKSSKGTLDWESLSRVLTLRLHLDRTTENNGALKVLPGSHRDGPLSDQQRKTLEIEPVLVEAEVGEVLLMSPLLVHASSPSREPLHRRVIHVEYLLA